MSTLAVEAGARVGKFALRVTFRSDARVIALFGPSGSGKTLTLRVVAGLIRPDVGRIEVGGRVLFDAASGVDVPARDRRIGFLFQNYALFPHLDTRQNIAYGLHGWARTERTARVQELLELVGLTDHENSFPSELSGGQQQRLGLARALAPRPRLLLLDEPFSAVDAPLRAQLRADVGKLARDAGIPVILVTHDPADVEALAEHVVRLNDGQVVGQEARAHPPP